VSRREIAVGLAVVSALVLAIGWALDARRIWEGPVEIVLAPGYGLHRMDLLVLTLAGLPWIGILATAIWPKRRR
jgi:hypothetical protein